MQQVVDLLRTLVRIPSRGGIDDYGPVLNAVQAALHDREVASTMLRDGEGPLGIHGEVRGARPGPIYLLNATVDTAPFGDLDVWTHQPCSADESDGWLYGRGSADSKAGVAIFCQVLGTLWRERAQLRGSVAFLFDAEEHSGSFGGIRSFLEHRPDTVSGAMIGYPGPDRIVVGCRGFFRAMITVHGRAAHSGSSSQRGINAISRAADLIAQLERLRLPQTTDPAFPLQPQLTVTAVSGGESFSTVPDWCTVNVDVRLTPSFSRADAETLLDRAVGQFDETSGLQPTTIALLPGWPAYQLPANAPVHVALREAARIVLGREIPSAVAGPSSIGNYLATKGIDATSGFGVRYRNIHAPDESVEIASIEPIYETYLTAARRLLR